MSRQAPVHPHSREKRKPYAQVFWLVVQFCISNMPLHLLFFQKVVLGSRIDPHQLLTCLQLYDPPLVYCVCTTLQQGMSARFQHASGAIDYGHACDGKLNVCLSNAGCQWSTLLLVVLPLQQMPLS